MLSENTAPATKADVVLLMDSIGKLYDANENWKNELKEHFDLVAENMRHDLLGANHEEIALLKDTQITHGRKIARIERHVGIAA